MSTDSHYQGHTADSYDSAFFYEKGAYTEYLQKLVQDRLCLNDANWRQRYISNNDDRNNNINKRKRRLLDVGGGTGSFTAMLLQQGEVASSEMEAIVVEPFLEQQSSNNDSDPSIIKFVKAPAEAFIKDESKSDDANAIWWRQNVHQVLLKEVVHHFKDSDRSQIFKGIYDSLLATTATFCTSSSSSISNIPSILIITRPQIDIDYPLWNEAKDVWSENQPSLDDIESDLQSAGFENVKHSIEAYPCAVQLERWKSMIRNRFWSTFSNFTDDELEKGILQIPLIHSQKVDNNGLIHFEDRLLFIVAQKVAR